MAPTVNSDNRAFARTVEPWPGPRPSPRPRARTRWRGTRHTSGRRVRSRGAHEDRSTGAPEAGCPGPTVKPDARISRRDGRDARPCPRTRHTPRRTGTAHVCQHPTTSPAPATLRHFRVVSFEAHFDWLFLFFEALTVLLLARRGFEKHEGIQHLASLASSIRLFERAARAPRHCDCPVSSAGVPTMHHASRSCPGLET